MFSAFLLLYYTDKLSGSIFLNFYLEGLACFIGYLIGLMLISWTTQRWGYFTAAFLLTTGALLTLLFEIGAFPCHTEESPYEKGSSEDEEYSKRITVPVSAFVAKCGAHALFGVTQFDIFSNPRTFPPAKRATGAGICLCIGFVLSMAAPITANVNQPYPIVVVLSLGVIAMGCSFLFPADDREEDPNAE